jgi:hypothetical protein
MLAAAGVIAAFVPIVVLVTLLQRRGRLGDPERRLPFATYGPFVAAALTAGAAAVHLGLIGEHALLALGLAPPIAAAANGAATAVGPATTTAVAGAGGLIGAAAFLCSVGAGSAHFAAVDPSIGGFLPLGVASLGLAPIHAIWSVPRLWRRAAGAIAGIVVALAALGVGLAPFLAGASGATAGPGASTTATLGYADVIGIILEAALVLVFALLVLRRPRSLLERLDVRVADAWIGTGLGVAAIAIFSLVAIVAGHTVH